MPGGGLISGAVGGLLDGMMREIWTGTLALLRAVMGLVGELGSLDVTPGGGAISNELWTTMLSLAAVIAVTLFFAQLAAAALNPRRHMFQAATGPVQYGVALALSVALVAGLLGAADGLSAVILQQGANVTDTAAAMDQLGLVDDNNAVKATVLGLLGIIAVVPLAIGYGITLLFRSASILVLVATLPITAAGLTNLATKTWFWRVARWLLALIFLKPAFALCFALGSGIVAAAGRTAGPAAPAAPPPGAPPPEALAPADGSGVVTLLLGLGIMFVALFAPYALFRLFAFIEPGTQPHQAMMSAFSSATAGLKSTVGGVANADIGSVLSGATGGRFAGGEGSAGGGGASGGLGGLLPGGGSGGSGGDSKKQQAAMAGMAAATGGASAAAGAAGGVGASSGAGGGASAGSGAAGAGAGSNGAARPVAASAGAGGTSSGGGDSGTREDGVVGEEDSESLAGAAASSGGGASAGGASGAGGGVGAASGAGRGASGGASGGPVAGAGGAAPGAAGSSGSSGSGGSGAGSGGGSGGGWSVASKAAGAAASVGSMGGGRVGAAAHALGGAASGVGSSAASIGGATPMPPSPMGGTAGSVGDRGLGDYSGGHLGGSAPRAPIPPRVVHSYRDESFDDPEPHHYGERGDRGDDEPDEQGMAGVIR